MPRIDPANDVMEGIAFGNALQQQRQAQIDKEVAQMKADRKEREKQMAFQRVMQKPTDERGLDDFIMLSQYMSPQSLQVIGKMWQEMPDPVRQEKLGTYARLYSLVVNDPAQAANMARQMGEMYAQGGDANNARAMADMAKLIEMNPGIARAEIGVALASLGEQGQDIIQSVSDMRKAGREEEKDLLDMEKTSAEIEYKEVQTQKLQREAEGKSKDDPKVAMALRRTINSFDQTIKAAEVLYNHPGLPGATGTDMFKAAYPVFGINKNEVEFGVLVEELKNKLFVKAIDELKALSERGSTGLGQLTEREGDKIQNAIANLDRKLDEKAFARQVEKVINQIKESRKLIIDAAREEGVVFGSGASGGYELEEKGAVSNQKDARLYQMYKSGRMSESQKASYKKKVESGVITLPEGGSL